MSIKDQSTLRILLYEGEGASRLSGSARFEAVRGLIEKGYAISRSADHCEVTPGEKSSVLVLGQFTSEPPEQKEHSPSGTAVYFRQLPGDSQTLLGMVEGIREQAKAAVHSEWKPWFPVIDYDRCTNCMQCLSFCLFGVYGVSEEQKIQVQNNDNCKTNCPACSRVCPEAAIMFPKYKAGPINGDVVSDQDLQREKMKIDISALLGGDVYQLLRDRSDRAKSRFSKERDADKALTERKKCLVKLQESGDIPMEVLMSLPSPEEIQRRAKEAAAKGEAALRATRQQASPAGS